MPGSSALRCCRARDKRQKNCGACKRALIPGRCCRQECADSQPHGVHQVKDRGIGADPRVSDPICSCKKLGLRNSYLRPRFFRRKTRFAGRSASLRMKYGYQASPNGMYTLSR